MQKLLIGLKTKPFPRPKVSFKSIGVILLLSLLVFSPLWALTPQETAELEKIFLGLEESWNNTQISIGDLRNTQTDLNNSFQSFRESTNQLSLKFDSLEKQSNSHELTLNKLNQALMPLMNLPEDLSMLQTEYNANQIRSEKALTALENSLTNMERKVQTYKTITWISVGVAVGTGIALGLVSIL